MTPDREAELLAQIETLTDRVIANSEAQTDADDLRRENAELRKLLADAPTSEAAVATLREWSASAGPAYEYGPGATHIAMSVAMARKILDEIDRLTGVRNQVPVGDATNHDRLSSHIFNAALMAAFPGLPATMTLDQAGRRVAAALNAAWPLIEQEVRAKIASEGATAGGEP